MELAKRIVHLSAHQQHRECTWSVCCFEIIGSGNKNTLERVKTELEETGKSSFTIGAGVHVDVTAVEGWNEKDQAAPTA